MTWNEIPNGQVFMMNKQPFAEYDRQFDDKLLWMKINHSQLNSAGALLCIGSKDPNRCKAGFINNTWPTMSNRDIPLLGYTPINLEPEENFIANTQT